MLNKLFGYLQSVLPQHLLSTFVGRIAESRQTWLKNAFIKWFIKTYKINMKEAMIENPEDYPNFNSFFIRQLKPQLRPIAQGKTDIVSPVDGLLCQAGQIHNNQLLQAKNFYFDLTALLGNDNALAKTFTNGTFSTFYLAPNNYHRVHMPLSGQLIKTIYVPGKLFSVNQMTSEIIPNLFSRNERLISIFKTEAGEVAIILVGAMIVGNIQTVWMKEPIRKQEQYYTTYSEEISLTKGAELGYFKLGSTVILIFEQDKISWSPSLKSNTTVQFGQKIASIS